MAYKVLIPQMIAQEGIDELKKNGHTIKFGSGAAEENLIRDVADCDAILLRTAPVTKKVLEAGPNLKIVARHGAGYNNVDIDAAAKLGIWVTNAPDSTTNSVAEFALGAIIHIARRTSLLSRKIMEGKYFFKNDHKGVDLKDKVLTIIGFGRIGSALAKKAYYGLDMKIQAYIPHPGKQPIPEYVKAVDWKTAFSSSDFISVHVPLTDKTRGFIGAEEFSLMKQTAFFINCARGEVVVESALTETLAKNKIAGAFLDVLCEEPPQPSNMLLHLENVVVTPHMASNTVECMRLMAVQAASQINLVLSGKEPTWPVNKPILIKC